jgi:hypothetical protein
MDFIELKALVAYCQKLFSLQMKKPPLHITFS